MLAAFTQACENEYGGTIEVPPGTYLLETINFQGPCIAPVAFNITGSFIAPADPSIGSEHWIMFTNIYGFAIYGNGSFDGQGSLAWPQNNCTQGPCPTLPVNATIEGITLLNSKYFHFHIFGCESMSMINIKINAPGDSPNTDGMHISYSDNIQITNLQIGTGDDCISLGPGSTNINITNVACGPGHGISIGSLGRAPGELDVHGISVIGCIFTGTQNGVRIKTWAPSPPSNVFDIVFQDIIVDGVFNPIVVDQFYCPYPSCDQGDSQVQITNVKFMNIRGTSVSNVSVDLNCSKIAPCEGIVFQDLNIILNDNQRPTIASCSNFNGTFSGDQIPSECIETT
ncbi:hypothetical protein Leryth_025622 [Lithospermum erythrorhizon]|nr:hypothetical protein Leryth_025622 [Lithospermum erythrorhizon]